MSQEKAEVQATISYLYRVWDGQIIRVEIYRSRKAALEAAGLSEQDARANS